MLVACCAVGYGCTWGCWTCAHPQLTLAPLPSPASSASLTHSPNWSRAPKRVASPQNSLAERGRARVCEPLSNFHRFSPWQLWPFLVGFSLNSTWLLLNVPECGKFLEFLVCEGLGRPSQGSSTPPKAWFHINFKSQKPMFSYRSIWYIDLKETLYTHVSPPSAIFKLSCRTGLEIGSYGTHSLTSFKKYKSWAPESGQPSLWEFLPQSRKLHLSIQDP